jgi:bifunctional DNA-binding transcriptional regulator/antitoxin component of YhaV-PrlF toxin-antitoxin module
MDFKFAGFHILAIAKESCQIPCMPQSTLTSKNQTTIPKVVIEALNLRPSDQLVYEIEADGRIILSAKTATFASVAASMPRKASRGSSRTVDEMKSAVKTMAQKRMTRSKS